MNLHDRTRIYVAPKRGTLPYRYRMGLDRPNYNWWHVALGLGCVMALTVVIWWVLR